MNSEQTKVSTEVVSYKDSKGFLRHFKVSTKNPRNFKSGDRYIVIDQSSKPQVVVSLENAIKLNESILTGDKIRKVYE